MTENELIQEIHRSSQMAIFAMDSVQNKVQDPHLSQSIAMHRQEMQSIATRAEALISQRHMTPQDQSAWSKASAWAGIQMNTMMDSSSSKIAEMMIQGNTMGVTSMTRDLHDSPALSPETKRLGEELISASRHNIDRMKPYL